jgi:ribonuclease VapC
VLVVDASALVAIAEGEADADRYSRALSSANQAVITPINVVETGLVLIGRQRLRDIDELNLWLADIGVEIDAANTTASDALAAYLTYGRGYHRAGLNLGDCFAYALAKSLDAPLLYRGNDFTLTDVRPALQPT